MIDDRMSISTDFTKERMVLPVLEKTFKNDIANDNCPVTDLTINCGKFQNVVEFVTKDSPWTPKYASTVTDFGRMKFDSTHCQLSVNNDTLYKWKLTDSTKTIKWKSHKSGNKKSFVWKYFNHPKNCDGTEDKSRTQCLECHSQLTFNASGTTTTMLNHLKSRHPKIAESEEFKKIRNSQIVTSTDCTDPQNLCSIGESHTDEVPKINSSKTENRISELNFYPLYSNKSEKCMDSDRPQKYYQKRPKIESPLKKEILDLSKMDKSSTIAYINKDIMSNNSKSSIQTEKNFKFSELQENKHLIFPWVSENNVTSSDKIIVYWLIKDMRPYSMLEETGIKILFSSLMPTIRIPSICYLKNRIVPSIYWKLRSEILNDFDPFCGTSFSIELWDNQNNSSMYASIKLYYYSKTNSQLCCKMFKTKEIGAKYLCSDLLKSCCEDICLDFANIQFLPVVMNNPEILKDELDNVGEIEQNKKVLIIPCLTDSLHEVVKFGLDEPQVIKLVDKCRALRELAQAYNIPLDTNPNIPTSDIKGFKAFKCYPNEKFESMYWVYTNLDQIVDKLDCYNTNRFSRTDECFLKQLTPLLEHIYQTLKVVEQNKLFFSASMIKTIIMTMNKSQFQPKDDDHEGVIKFKMSVKKHLNKVYPNKGMLHEILWISTFLDPRFKKYFEHFTSEEIQIIQMLRIQIKKIDETSSRDMKKVQPVIKREKLHSIFGDDCLAQESKSEVDQYLTQHKIDIEKDPIRWWQDNKIRYPTLSKLALRYLCIPLSNHYDFESSGNGAIMYSRRKELDPDEIDYYLFLNHNWNLI